MKTPQIEKDCPDSTKNRAIKNETQEQPKLCFLESSDWSRRYDQNFFTIKIASFETITSPKDDSIAIQDPGCKSDFKLSDLSKFAMKSFPACFYKIEIYYGDSNHTCLRRYSQFRWLHDKLSSSLSLKKNNERLKKTLTSMPPKTSPFHVHGTEFIEGRMKELEKFLVYVLPGNETFDAMIVFLELNKILKSMRKDV